MTHWNLELIMIKTEFSLPIHPLYFSILVLGNSGHVGLSLTSRSSHQVLPLSSSKQLLNPASLCSSLSLSFLALVCFPVFPFPFSRRTEWYLQNTDLSVSILNDNLSVMLLTHSVSLLSLTKGEAFIGSTLSC